MSSVGCASVVVVVVDVVVVVEAWQHDKEGAKVGA